MATCCLLYNISSLAFRLTSLLSASRKLHNFQIDPSHLDCRNTLHLTEEIILPSSTERIPKSILFSYNLICGSVPAILTAEIAATIRKIIFSLVSLWCEFVTQILTIRSIPPNELKHMFHFTSQRAFRKTSNLLFFFSVRERENHHCFC